MLDGDDLRHGLTGDLGFAPEDRRENVRRAGEVARLLVDAGAVVLCTFVSPSREGRAAVRARFAPDDFAEAHVTARLETLRARDPKGLYARAERGEIPNLTGVGAPYEAPDAPELDARHGRARARRGRRGRRRAPRRARLRPGLTMRVRGPRPAGRQPRPAGTAFG